MIIDEKKLSRRGSEWLAFSLKVLEHIEKYTIPQYGDMPNDIATEFSKSEFDMQIAKYVMRQRRGGGARGQDEDMRDYLKIAHYAGMCYSMIESIRAVEESADSEAYHGT